jgi:hypothetical protein
MAAVCLVHPSETRQVSGFQLILKCKLFQETLSLVAAPYTLKCVVPVHIFQIFTSAVEDQPIQITNENYSDLTLLCDEFGFEALSKQLNDFRQSPAFKVPHSPQESELHERIIALEELIHEQEHRIASFQSNLISQELTTMVLNNAVQRISQLENSFIELVDEIKTLRAACLTVEQSAIDSSTEVLPEPVPVKMDSKIVQELPELFNEFLDNEFNLLWRGTREGFNTSDFHTRCDGHSNILMIVKDAKGNIFGGFTPVTWESRAKFGSGMNCYKSDNEVRSWLFTLINPHNIAPRKFYLKNDYRSRAIFCGCSGGPEFGTGCDGFGDIAVRDKCDANVINSTWLGGSYLNDTGVNGKILLSGEYHFIVKEIEVFEIVP